MLPVDALTEQSLRDYGLMGTLAILGFIFAIVYMWKRPSADPSAAPMEALKDTTKLIPFVLEEAREGNRLVREMLNRQDHARARLERLEHEIGIVKDRMPR
ncbi:hypothetical protein [Falsirhodobacter sp. 20TX0035]|uniref:hypothetical protein n=1 Tax=Falsirhodobacter sp. 20TX0035 TaxID=3022019 RepID=UPI00232DB538|nr:hypothetical protein [Falsirhodobacter sp. 20TX0035]MDB6455132.1 hypothetical protein [Falsirhodobacter sp. 20TX0035]